MNIDFPLILVLFTAFCGVMYLINVLFFKHNKKTSNKMFPAIIDYGASFFLVFLIVLVIRSFIIQPFRVPSGSLEPTILPNDFIVVSQFAYGLRLPVLNTKIVNIGEPKRGDIVVFRFPGNTHVNFVKRVIGLPGDHVIYKNKILTINGRVMSQKFLRKGVDIEPGFADAPVNVMEENLDGVKHEILIRQAGGAMANYDVVIPLGQYFMMGDNRDASADSRFWGFVPEGNLVGKGLMIWLSWDSRHWTVRWSRIGKLL